MALGNKLCLLALFLSLIPASIAGAKEQVVLKTQQDKINYGTGVNIVRNFGRQGIDIDLDMIIKGMRDAFSGEKLLITEEDLRATMTKFQNELRLKQQVVLRSMGGENTKKGDAFLTENKNKEGVVALPNGLQYLVLRAGEGRTPTDEDTVEVRYRGTLIDGTEFDNSTRSGQPTVALKVKEMIIGCKEALKLMPVGSKWELFVPPQLAYGVKGTGREVGPNATLIFEMELVAIR